MKLDKFDIAILEALQRDARISLQALSSQVGLSSSPCWTRIKRMEEAGVIEGYSVRVNAERIGLADVLYRHFGITAEAIADEARRLLGRAA